MVEAKKIEEDQICEQRREQGARLGVPPKIQFREGRSLETKRRRSASQ